MGERLWTALALVLLMESLLPFMAPAAWRRMMQQLMQWEDGQIRFCALIGLLAAIAMLSLA